ncbi:hypothetical protein R1flu_005878 [Riccia fluitans]|uniref:Uncharacterized protein n=1 Tax=Riccia fluitans TaxID=41844 RepID=A0ABD1YUF6_9MARC
MNPSSLSRSFLLSKGGGNEKVRRVAFETSRLLDGKQATQLQELGCSMTVWSGARVPVFEKGDKLLKTGFSSFLRGGLAAAVQQVSVRTRKKVSPSSCS